VKGFQDWVREKLPVSQLAAQPADDRIAAANRELQDKRT
jgi:hypothetical protein